MQNHLPLWPSPRTTENTQAARRKGAGPRQQLCRQTNAAVQKAGAERHILLGSSHRARRPLALRLAGCALALAPGRTSVPRRPSATRKFSAGSSSSKLALQVRGASQGPLGPPSELGEKRSGREAPPRKARGAGDTVSGGASAPQPVLGQRKALLFPSSQLGCCCINQLSPEPRRKQATPKQTKKKSSQHWWGKRPA